MSSQIEATTDIRKVIDGYFSMWNTTDPVQRRMAIEATWSPDARYLDPMVSADSRDGLDAMVAGVQAQFPGYHFRMSRSVDVHNNRALWDWELAPPDGGDPVAVGLDVGILSPDGRLREVTGFFK